MKEKSNFIKRTCRRIWILFLLPYFGESFSRHDLHPRSRSPSICFSSLHVERPLNSQVSPSKCATENTNVKPFDDDGTQMKQAFEYDVTKVLRELRPHQYDPTVPHWFRVRQLSFTNYWGLDEWEIHSSRRRYIRYVAGFHKSRLLKRIFPQLVVLNVWSIIAVRIARHWGFHRLEVPLTSLSLVSGFVGVLQTLRSNQGLTRLKEARLAMGRMVLLTRDTALLISTYIYPKDPVLGMRAARHLALFGWVLKSHYRETGATDIIDTLLSKQDAAYVKYQRKRPVAILFRLRQIMANVADRQLVTTTEHRLIEDNIRSLDDVIMTGERIRASPVPPVYNAHATRLMMFYLFCLPMALLGSAMDSVAAIVVTMVVGFAMLGLDELSHMFEQPFKFMPLYQLSKVSMMDVADAFCRPPPPLDLNDELITVTAKPSYWTRKGKDPRLPYDGAQFS